MNFCGTCKHWYEENEIWLFKKCKVENTRGYGVSEGMILRYADTHECHTHGYEIKI